MLLGMSGKKTLKWLPRAGLPDERLSGEVEARILSRPKEGGRIRSKRVACDIDGAAGQQGSEHGRGSFNYEALDIVDNEVRPPREMWWMPTHRNINL